MKVLISIKPEFVEKIFSGEKQFDIESQFLKDKILIQS